MGLQSNLVHCVIAVGEHSPDLPHFDASRLQDFLLEAAQEMGAHQFAAGGSRDHIHLLISVPANIALSTIIDGVKEMSQRWLSASVHGCNGFQWEEGYTAFSVGIPQVRETIAYIDRQMECHRRIGYEQELLLFAEAYQLATPTMA